jgi:hypothetical protein
MIKGFIRLNSNFTKTMLTNQSMVYSIIYTRKSVILLKVGKSGLFSPEIIFQATIFLVYLIFRV